jgi:hypothetical protein
MHRPIAHRRLPMTHDYQELIIEQRGPVALVKLNRPDKLNSWGGHMSDELSHYLTSLNSGGDDDSSDSDSSSDSGSSSSSGGSSSSGSKDGFCTPEYADAVFEGFDPLSGTDDLEDEIKEMNKLLDRWADDAPSEIRDDVRIIVDTMHGFFEILEENDFDLMAMALSAEDDERLMALDSTAFNNATNRLNEYCGYEDITTDVDTGSSTTPSDDGGSTTGGFTQGTLPDDFPSPLIPPDSTIGIVGDFGVGTGAEFISTATVDDIIEFYKKALGDPTLSSSEGTLWSTSQDGQAITVTVSGSDGAVEIIATAATP